MKMSRIGFALLLGTGFAAGCVVSPMLRVSPASADTASHRDNLRMLNLFDEVLQRVQSDYVEPVTSQTLIQNALNGMLTGLDPHSAYMSPQEWREMQTETSGKFGGIGLEVTDKDGLLQVISPIDGTPAAEAGIRSGDIITAVDGHTVEGLSLDQAVAQLRGAPDSKVTVVLKRQNVTDPVTVHLTRRIIQVDSVKNRLAGDIGVIRISEFTEQTDSGVHAAMKSLNAQAGGNLHGLILDLRNDPGGLLDQAIAVAGDFLNRGTIVSTRGRHPDDNEKWVADYGSNISGNLPIVILTNNGTASAAEIVSGALQDDKRAVVLGTRTFGKGSVQTIFPLRDHGAIRLTTALYYTPNGRSIQGLGITPNVEVRETAKPEQHFGPERESDLRHILSNPDGKAAAGPTLPQADLPPVAQQIPKAPPANWPELDPAKPDTDFQLQQALVLVHAMATVNRAALR